jgi:hypothetical protein
MRRDAAHTIVGDPSQIGLVERARYNLIMAVNGLVSVFSKIWSMHTNYT